MLASKNQFKLLGKQEVLFDLLGFPFKIFSQISQPSHALNAELSRSAIAILDHFTHYISGFWSRKEPDEKHNYGYLKYRSLIGMIPGTWYIMSGVKHCYDVFYQDLFQLGSNAPMGLAFLAAACLVDLKRIDRKIQLIKSSDSVSERVSLAVNFLMKKKRFHPWENKELKKSFYNLYGSTITLLTGSVCLLTGSMVGDVVGQVLLGALQV